jgi:hypothetical protein
MTQIVDGCREEETQKHGGKCENIQKVVRVNVGECRHKLALISRLFG